LAAGERTHEFRGREAIGDQTMKDTRDVLRIIGMILLGIFVFVVAVPFVLTLVFKLVGVTFGIISFFISLAVLLIKVAVVLAIGYLILVGIRALLR
jgi:hypothetical protein